MNPRWWGAFPILFQNVACVRSRHPLNDPPFLVRRNDLITAGPPVRN
jgi:hypothetical protein